MAQRLEGSFKVDVIDLVLIFMNLSTPEGPLMKTWEMQMIAFNRSHSSSTLGIMLCLRFKILSLMVRYYFMVPFWLNFAFVF